MKGVGTKRLRRIYPGVKRTDTPSLAMTMKCIIAVLILTVTVSAQAPEPDELDIAMRELQRVIAETRTELALLREAERQRRAREARMAARASGPVRRRPTKSERQRIDRSEFLLQQQELMLVSEIKLQTLEEMPAVKAPEDQKKLILRLAVERDTLEEKIKKNNRSFRCRILRLGCIKVGGVRIR